MLFRSTDYRTYGKAGTHRHAAGSQGGKKILGKTKAELWKIRDAVHGQMGKIDLEIKPNERVFPVEEGIDFLGYVIRPDYVRLRKRIKQKTAYEILGCDWSSDVCSSDLTWK